MRIGILVCLLSGWCLSSLSAGEVTLVSDPQSVVVRIDGEVFTVLHTGTQWRKLFLNPVTAAGGLEQLAMDVTHPSGEPGLPGSRVLICRDFAEVRLNDQPTGKLAQGQVVEVREVKRPWLFVPEANGWVHEGDVAPLGSTVTRVIQTAPQKGLDRQHPLYYDHPHHKGVWFSVDEVNEIKFWNEDGRILPVSTKIDVEKGEFAQLTQVSHWLSKEDTPLLEETTTMRFYADRTMSFDFELKAQGQAVHFGDTKEGLFAIRLPNSMREFSQGGPVTNAEGLTTTAQCWGQPSPWVDYAGPVGQRRLAVTLFDHPQNFRKSRYHVRDYGLFSVSPFGEKAYSNGAQPEAIVNLEPGQSLKLKYGLNVRADTGNNSEAKAAYERYAGR